MPLSFLPDDSTHFHAILAALPGNFMLLRPDAPTYTIVAMSAELLRQTDREGEQVVGQSVFEAYPENAEEATNSGPVQLRTALDACLRDQQPHELPLVRYDVRTADGRFEERYWSGRSQAVRDAQGHVLYLLFTSVDRTEQQRADLAQQAREAERGQLLNLFRVAPAGICILSGPDFVFDFVNPLYQWLLPGRELLGRPFFEALPELVGSSVEAIQREVYATGQKHEVQALLIPVARTADGALEDRYFTFVYQPQQDEAGQVNSILGFCFEVTEQVEARQAAEVSAHQGHTLARELATANEQLRRTNGDLDNFIYTASHDLKAPIANIEGLLHALEHELPPAGRVGEVSNMLHLMQQAVERFGRTIGHLTDISRLQHEHDQAPSLVSLARVVHEVELDLAPLLAQSQARLRVDVPAEVLLHFSEKNLRSVVYNLLSNALKYRHPDRVPDVRVGYAQRATGHVLAVRDNGLGLDLAQDGDKLFGMFKRLHGHVEGTGVGLYMVKKIVENAGGRIEVDSVLGQGSTFWVHLPR